MILEDGRESTGEVNRVVRGITEWNGGIVDIHNLS